MHEAEPVWRAVVKPSLLNPLAKSPDWWLASTKHEFRRIVRPMRPTLIAHTFDSGFTPPQIDDAASITRP
jgi:hypothetical protein